jgi:hypothetical protein
MLRNPAGLSSKIIYAEANYPPRAWMAELGQPQDSKIDDFKVEPIAELLIFEAERIALTMCFRQTVMGNPLTPR